MNDFLDYIKCGEVLLSPSITDKVQYTLKCSDCDEFYYGLELFIRHCVDHYKEGRDTPNESERDDNEDVAGSRTTITKCKEISADEIEDMDPLTILKQEHVYDNGEISAEEGFQSVENNAEEEDAESVENIAEEDETESVENNAEEEESEGVANNDYGDETLKTRKSKTFVRNFMKSEKKVTTLIRAYENQPLLWNTDVSFQIRAKDRPNYLLAIATEIKENINVEITHNQVAAVISHLRREYRNKLNTYVTKEKCGTIQRKSISPICYFEHLEFLRPFLEINSLTNFDSRQPELKPRQVIQILDIYERFPHLWNTDLIEHVCRNKRLEALEEMQDVIESEMGLTTTQNSLKRYIYSIHIHFGREKRRNMGGVNTTKDVCRYYQDMIFLLDHVAPFKCSQCDREFQSPLTLKIHNSQHEGLGTLTCSLCNKEYRTIGAYTIHGRRHMNDLKEECDECGKKFMRLADLNIHKRSHTGDTPYCCEICGSSFRYSTELTTHRRRHKKQYLHKCPICSKGFYEKRRMRDHIKTHTNIRDFVCKTCGKAFKLPKTLKQHEFIHEEGRNHICTLCGKTFKNKIGLSHHMRTHRRKIEFDDADFSSISIFKSS